MYYDTVPYHVYNQSNNSQLVYTCEADYLLFLTKLRQHILPVADLLCYCLMPTHFHLLLLPKLIGCALLYDPVREGPSRQQNIHSAFRTLLSSYTRKTNPKYNRRGSLFRAKTRYKPGYAGFIPDAIELQEDEPFTRYVPYLKTCFDYIHGNPKTAGLVAGATDWVYSSALDYAGLRDGTLCNYGLTERLLGVKRRV